MRYFIEDLLTEPFLTGTIHYVSRNSSSATTWNSSDKINSFSYVRNPSASSYGTLTGMLETIQSGARSWTISNRFEAMGGILATLLGGFSRGMQDVRKLLREGGEALSFAGGDTILGGAGKGLARSASGNVRSTAELFKRYAETTFTSGFENSSISLVCMDVRNPKRNYQLVADFVNNVCGTIKMRRTSDSSDGLIYKALSSTVIEFKAPTSYTPPTTSGASARVGGTTWFEIGGMKTKPLNVSSVNVQMSPIQVTHGPVENDVLYPEWIRLTIQLEEASFRQTWEGGNI